MYVHVAAKAQKASYTDKYIQLDMYVFCVDQYCIVIWIEDCI